MNAFETQWPRENIYGHTKKVRLICERLSGLRQAQGDRISVLDLGCGNGSAVTRFLADVADYVLGVDMHEPSVHYATKMFARPGLEFRCGEVLSENVSPAFDVVVMADILEHVSRPFDLLMLAARAAKPNGRMFITIPNGYGPFEIESAVSRTPLGKVLLRGVDLGVAVLNKSVLRDMWTRCVIRPEDIPYNIDNGHVNFFTTRALLGLAGRAGLRLINQAKISWLSGPYTNYFFAPFETVCNINCAVADRLPASLVSGWLFEFEKVAS